MIPKEIRERLNLREGTELEFRVSGNTILVEPERSPEERVDAFLSTGGRKRRKRIDWTSLLDEEYRAPAGK